MFDEGQLNYYEILEVPTDANQHDIRSAYLKLKSAYNRDSLALYTLISKDETESLLKKIEEAYQILSHTEKRKAYDKNFLGIQLDTPEVEQFAPTRSSHKEEPILEQSHFTPDDLLVSPSTDFFQNNSSSSRNPIESSIFISPGVNPTDTARSKSETPIESELAQEIQAQAEWKGDFLKKIRESLNISIEEMAEHTKISKNYIKMIEEEHYEKLPATVYLRGFLLQIARKLKIPTDNLIQSYILRVKRHRKER